MQHGFLILLDGPMADLAGMAPPVFAYLDPGTGSYAVQLLLAGFFGGMFALKQSWADLKGRLESWRSGRSRRPASDLPDRP